MSSKQVDDAHIEQKTGAEREAIESLSDGAAGTSRHSEEHGSPRDSQSDLAEAQQTELKDQEPHTNTTSPQQDATTPNPTDTTLALEPTTSAPLHSVFPQRVKIFIVTMAGIGAFISPLSTNIYFPALNTLARYYDVTPTAINLSLTTYMIFQAIAPSFFGDFGDSSGHRPAFMLTLIVYFAANVALALQSSYAALLVLRCLQSTGASGTVALRNGVIAEVFTPAERATYLGLVNAGGLIAPAFAPLLGGILTEFLGWRSTFWALVILSGVFMIVYGLFQPETNRKIVGNGSIPPTMWYNMNAIDVWRARKEGNKEDVEQGVEGSEKSKPAPIKHRMKWPNPLKTLIILKEKDVAVLMFLTAIVYTALYDVISSTPVIFARIYGFNDLQVGLCYIPIGIGCAISAVLGGRLLNHNFERVAKAHGIPITKKRRQDLRHFPIEKARLQLVIPGLVVLCIFMIGYGWLLEAQVNLAGPLIFQFVLGATTILIVNGAQNMMVDMYPQSPSTVSAASNLTRCLMGAGGTALINPMLNAMGDGWTYTLIGAICALSAPLCLLLTKKGPKWREARAVRADNRAQAKADAEKEKQSSKA